ncbi:unnamed protein product [Clavelina lepadiformis]|uniref:C2H2-type domain-containing protein n=1 Tax=Clavelina lepadiformis TaxID=159417 RepID=A0ABP0FDT6_CLALP
MNKLQAGNYLDVWRQKKQQICFEKEQCGSYSATRKDNSDEIMAKNSTANGVQVTSSNMSLYYDLHATHPVIGGHNHTLSTVQRVADPNPQNLPTSAPLFDGMACSVAATLPENTEKPTRKKQRYVKMHGKTVDSKRFSCPTSACTKRFSTEKELQIHINKHHIGMAKPYFCGYCSKSFKRPDQLKRHEKIHTGEKPHKCTICGRPFARTDHRNTHYKKHNSLEKNNAKFLQDTSANNIPQSYTNGDTASSQYDAFQRWV